jgi:CDP-diacylglycerol--glycerol-3-phosphate 3-phosphatidyltransferase/archaetidylinositol phosphate synthase
MPKVVEMLGKLRERYQNAVAPIGEQLARIGLSPNSMTLLSLLISLLSAWAYIIEWPLVGAALVLFMGVADMFDGAIARATQRVTRFGATLDHVADRYAEAVILFGMVLGGYLDWAYGFFTLFGMIMASFTRAKAESVGGLASCTVGIAERQEKLLLLIGGSIALAYASSALNYAALAVGILSHVTVAQRLRFTWVQTGGN